MFEVVKNNIKVELKIHIPADEWEKGVQAIYERTKGKYSVLGFRKGHAPRKVIEKEYGDGVFFDDTLNYFYEKTMQEAIAQNPALEPAVAPQLAFESFTVDDGLKIKVSYEVVGDFKLPKIDGVKIDVHSADVKDHEVESAIKHHLEESASFETVDREVKDGDIAVIDYVGSVDGVEFEGGKAENYNLEIGSHTFIDNFEEQLIGLKAGETKDVHVTFPKEYHAANLQNAKALFKVTVKEVKKKSLPELNDKFVADTTEFETVEEYRKSVKDNISKMKADSQHEEYLSNINKYLTDNTEIEFPKALLEDTYHRNFHAVEDRAQMFGMSTLDFVRNFGGSQTVEEFMKKSNENALMQLKLREIYVRMIDEFKLALSAEEEKEAIGDLKDEHQIADKLNRAQIDKIQKYLCEKMKMNVTE